MPICPDCDVSMEAVEHQTFGEERISLRTEGGLLSALGLDAEYLNSYLCPDCRLVRFYAD